MTIPTIHSYLIKIMTGVMDSSQESSLALSNSSDVSSDSIRLSPGRINHKKVLQAFFKKHDPQKIKDIDNILAKSKGKEEKTLLLLAKKYDCSNPLNVVFIKLVTDEHHEDYLALTTLFLAVFYPQDVGEAAKLCQRYKKEELFKRLSSNFHAINPLKMDKKISEVSTKPIDYKQLLTEFYQEHDDSKVADVEETLAKLEGREAILFAMLATKYSTTNALNSVFEERVKNVQITDHLSLLKIYLSVFHPSYLPNSKSLLLKNKGDEDKLFAELANKFSAVNALDVCGDSIGKGGLDIINESSEEKENAPSVVSKENGVIVSKKVTKDKSGSVGKKANIKKVRRPLGNSRLVNA